MEKCSVCGQETQLHRNGRFLCDLCDSDHTQQLRATVEVLWGNVTVSKHEHRRLSDEFDQINREALDGSHGIPYPDSIHRIEQIGDRTRAAFQKYQRAMELYVEALKRVDAP